MNGAGGERGKKGGDGGDDQEPFFNIELSEQGPNHWILRIKSGNVLKN